MTSISLALAAATIPLNEFTTDATLYEVYVSTSAAVSLKTGDFIYFKVQDDDTTIHTMDYSIKLTADLSLSSTPTCVGYIVPITATLTYTGVTDSGKYFKISA